MRTILVVALLAVAAVGLAPVAAAHEYVCTPEVHPKVASGCREVSNLFPDCWTYVGLDPQSVCLH